MIQVRRDDRVLTHTLGAGYREAELFSQGFRRWTGDWSFTGCWRRTIPASAQKSIPTNSRRRNFGKAAAAIMAALSVDSARDGKKTGRPCIAASHSNVVRNSWLAATPPLTKRVRTSYSRAAVSVFVTRSLTIERWKEATRLRVCRSQSLSGSSSVGLPIPASVRRRASIAGFRFCVSTYRKTAVLIPLKEK